MLFKECKRLLFFKKWVIFLEHMIENPRREEETIIEDLRNLARLEKLKKEKIDTTIKDIWNLFRLEKE